MVLQPPGCGRVGHRHNTPNRKGRHAKRAVPLVFAALRRFATARRLVLGG